MKSNCRLSKIFFSINLYNYLHFIIPKFTMKNIQKLLFCCILFLFSCEVERVAPNSASADKKPNQSENNDTESSDDDDEECETFFAFGAEEISNCFFEDDFNRWGWTNGPLQGGEYNFDLYAGAGQCDLEKGTLVGLLTISYDEITGSAEIEFEMNEGYFLSETHLYIGNEPYPTDNNGNYTVAPGQFPFQHQLDDVESDSYTINDLSGEIYVIAHGVVCNDDNNSDDDNGGDDGNGGPF